jgi:uncharacterized tellurite resistance protein B-like protein
MFEYLRKVLSTENDEHAGTKPIKPKESKLKKLQIASAALFVEIAEADGKFSDDERNRIIDLMRTEFNLDEKCVKELLSLSEQKVKDSVSVYEFTSVINESFNNKEKLELIKNLWRIIYQDGKLDSHEDRLIKIIGSTMNLEHRDVIGAKLLVKEEMGK